MNKSRCGVVEQLVQQTGLSRLKVVDGIQCIRCLSSASEGGPITVRATAVPEQLMSALVDVGALVLVEGKRTPATDSRSFRVGDAMRSISLQISPSKGSSTWW